MSTYKECWDCKTHAPSCCCSSCSDFAGNWLNVCVDGTVVSLVPKAQIGDYPGLTNVQKFNAGLPFKIGDCWYRRTPVIGNRIRCNCKFSISDLAAEDRKCEEEIIIRGRNYVLLNYNNPVALPPVASVWYNGCPYLERIKDQPTNAKNFYKLTSFKDEQAFLSYNIEKFNFTGDSSNLLGTNKIISYLRLSGEKTAFPIVRLKETALKLSNVYKSIWYVEEESTERFKLNFINENLVKKPDVSDLSAKVAGYISTPSGYAHSYSFQGKIITNNSDTFAFFQYSNISGKNSDFFINSINSGSWISTRPVNIKSSEEPVIVNAKIDGLAKNQKYFYRLIAYNSKGTTIGSDKIAQNAPSDFITPALTLIESCNLDIGLSGWSLQQCNISQFGSPHRANIVYFSFSQQFVNDCSLIQYQTIITPYRTSSNGSHIPCPKPDFNQKPIYTSYSCTRIGPRILTETVVPPLGYNLAGLLYVCVAARLRKKCTYGEYSDWSAPQITVVPGSFVARSQCS